jgi:hypothetical protein
MLPARVMSAVETNAPIMKIAEQTRHKSLDMLRVYSWQVDLFRKNAGAAFFVRVGRREECLSRCKVICRMRLMWLSAMPCSC